MTGFSQCLAAAADGDRWLPCGVPPYQQTSPAAEASSAFNPQRADKALMNQVQTGVNGIAHTQMIKLFQMGPCGETRHKAVLLLELHLQTVQCVLACLTQRGLWLNDPLYHSEIIPSFKQLYLTVPHTHSFTHTRTHLKTIDRALVCENPSGR